MGSMPTGQAAKWLAGTVRNGVELLGTVRMCRETILVIRINLFLSLSLAAQSGAIGWANNV